MAFTREEASQIRQEFWKTFGQYMAYVPSAEGMRINWINYKTKLKYFNFRMNAEKRSASIMIEISHPDEDIQALMFEQLQQLRKLLEAALEEEWEWLENVPNDSFKNVSVVRKEIEDVSIFNKAQWPQLISFFKERIIKLDEFWCDAQYGFEIFK